MKKQNFLFLMVLLAMMSVQVNAQKKGKVVLNTNEVPEVTHVHLDDFPKGEVLPMFDGWGGLAVDINRAPAGTDFSPLLAGLKNDKCQVPHWGYVIEGAVRIIYEDGKEEVFSEGEAFYMKPGHTAIVEKDLFLVSFSPEDGMHDLADHLNKKVAEMHAHE
ncbi:MAG: hypothetical protein ABFS38_21330 [Bacteroidota bacterium]